MMNRLDKSVERMKKTSGRKKTADRLEFIWNMGSNSDSSCLFYREYYYVYSVWTFSTNGI